MPASAPPSERANSTPTTEVTVVVADAYPNFSICGIPYYVSGEVTHWRNLAHRTLDDLKATGMQLRLNTLATEIDVAGHRLHVVDEAGVEDQIAYDQLVVGTGAVSARPPIDGLAGPHALGPADGVHLLHSMGDTFELVRTLEEDQPASAVIVGAGYIGLEMAEGSQPGGFTSPSSNSCPRCSRPSTRASALWSTPAQRARRRRAGPTPRSSGSPEHPGFGRPLPDRRRRVAGAELTTFADLVLVVVGVRPDTELAASAGAELGDRRGHQLWTGRCGPTCEGVFAAGDCVITHHRLMGLTYLPLGTTAHKQGRVAGENALGGRREFAGSLGTQVVKVFDMAASRTGLRDHEALAAGFDPVTVEFEADDHKAYYPAATASACATPATAGPAGSSASSSSATSTPRSPSASTLRRQPSSTR